MNITEGVAISLPESIAAPSLVFSRPAVCFSRIKFVSLRME
jgi:hypothetical protein